MSRQIGAAELARHNQTDDCWIVVDGKVSFSYYYTSLHDNIINKRNYRFMIVLNI